MTTLDDFGAGTGDDPPRIQKQNPVHGGRNADGGKRTVGYHGPMPARGCRGFVTKRDSETHKIHAISPNGAYAISTDALERLASLGIGRILVHETDTGRVLEYRFDEFANGPQVPESISGQADPQLYQRPSDAWATWDDHGDDLYIPRNDDLI